MSAHPHTLLPSGTELAVRLLMVPARALRTSLGRRLLAVAALSLPAVALVSTLYANADTPLEARPVAAGKPAAAQPTAKPAQPQPEQQAKPRGADRPEQAAIAWYARAQDVDPDQVRALQQQKVSDRERRVLVAATGGKRVPSALVTVRRDDSGWTVR